MLLLSQVGGPKMEGQTYTDWTGNTNAKYSPQPNNVEDFFETGRTVTNSIAVAGGTEEANFRLSYANLQNKGLVPTSEFERNTVGFRGGVKKGKLSFDGKINYFNVKGYNRPYMAETMENPMWTFLNMPRSVSLNDLRANAYRDGGTLQLYE